MEKENINEDCFEEFTYKHPDCEDIAYMCWDWGNNELYIDARMMGFYMPESINLVKKYNIVISNTWPCVSIKDACDIMPEQKENLLYLKKYFINNYDIWVD